jgi:pimeloyl-ACP methyl ester carboxylesterase
MPADRDVRSADPRTSVRAGNVSGMQFYGCQQTGREGLSGRARRVLAVEYASRPEELLRERDVTPYGFHASLERFDVPTLILHGDDDQIVPAPISAMKAAGIIKDAKDIIYPGAPHGITATHQDEINSELLRFVES